MEKIKLAKGLIALGGQADLRTTRFALKYANHLAKNERVLYVSYKLYKEKLDSIIFEMDEKINDNLELNPNFEHLGLTSFFQFYEKIRTDCIDVLIIDDIECFCPINRNKNFSENYDPVLMLKHLSQLTNIKVLFITNTKRIYSCEYDADRPKLQDFWWSRNIINECSQIYALYYPEVYGMLEDADGNSLEHIIELHHLKNENNSEEVFSFFDLVL